MYKGTTKMIEVSPLTERYVSIANEYVMQIKNLNKKQPRKRFKI